MEMEQEKQQEQRPPPPAYTQHEPESIHLPSVPTHALPSHKHNDRLPGIRSLDLPDIAAAHNSRHEVEVSPKSNGDAMQWSALPPLSSATFPRVSEGLPRGSMEMDVGSPMDTASVASMQTDGSHRREMSVLSVDDPDVRLAAEALSGLGNPDFVRSPTSRSLTIPRDSAGSTEPEPLLSLLTSNHPWLGGTINGSISAYNTTKTYSPRFVKYGAELIERNIGSPVVNTVSSVGRRTGVEKNLRRYLGEVHRRPSDLEKGDDAETARKRPRVMSPTATADAMDIEEAFPSRTRGGSQSSYAETLPAYDDQRSPKYEEKAVVVVDTTTGKETTPTTRTDSPTTSSSTQQQNRRVNWSTQLIMTTSGLGVALSDASLTSLRSCLVVLRSATSNIDGAVRALKLVLKEYEGEIDGPSSSSNQDLKSSSTLSDQERDERVRQMADRMKSLVSEIWRTLQSVVQTVSSYTGGALPQNAETVVRSQLLSVPQRWRNASRTEHGEEGRGEEIRGANRMLRFAGEGMEMIGQITTVIDGTVQSAEGWLGRMGRSNGSAYQQQQDTREGAARDEMVVDEKKGFGGEKSMS